MKKPIKNQKINVRATKRVKQDLKRAAKIMNISQADVISIALSELLDLLKQYPKVDYRPDLNGFLLRKDSLDPDDY
jgi:hypothetical protein